MSALPEPEAVAVHVDGLRVDAGAALLVKSSDPSTEPTSAN